MEQLSYKRFVSYIYTYNHMIKQKNTGFVKVEVKKGLCRFYLVLNNLSVVNQEPLQVFAFITPKEKDEQIAKLLLGRIYLSNNHGELKYQSKEHGFAESVFSLGDIGGLIIQNSQQFLVTFWKEEIEIEQLMDNSKKNEIEEKEKPLIKVKEEEVKEEVKEELKIQEIDSVKNQHREVWNNLKKELPQMKDLKNPLEFLRIRKCDLKKLPKKYWNLEKNYFLQYAYCRGKHMVIFANLTEEDIDGIISGHYYLGIPGCNPFREDTSAKIHGFYQYLKTSCYGYWYIEIDLG